MRLSIVGAAEGCDLLTLAFSESKDRSIRQLLQVTRDRYNNCFIFETLQIKHTFE
jgi:hypothetical protein